MQKLLLKVWALSIKCFPWRNEHLSSVPRVHVNKVDGLHVSNNMQDDVLSSIYMHDHMCTWYINIYTEGKIQMHYYRLSIVTLEASKRTEIAKGEKIGTIVLYLSQFLSCLNFQSNLLATYIFLKNRHLFIYTQSCIFYVSLKLTL